jgi:branched-chain amino acid transport system ATP-binding protein
MLSIKNLSVSIQAVEILRAVDMEVPEGTMCGLIGRNGAGKTTLMRAVMGLLSARQGSLAFGANDLARMAAHTRSRLGIGYMPEDRRLIPDLSVEENLLMPAWANQMTGITERLQRVYAAIPEIKEFAARRASQLSGGQQKLVALGRALMPGTRLLLLDEPFEGVAPALCQRLIEVVESLKRQGLSVLLSESDLQHSARLLNRVYRIDRGSVSSV